MDEIPSLPQTTSPEQPAQPPMPPLTPKEKFQRFMIIVGVFVIIALLIAAVIFLFNQDVSVTGKVRDIFIIFMALESLIIGVALVILIIQIAVLTNLVQNEIKPILDSTSETVNTLRGTVTFVSNNLAEPIIKLNEYLAGLKKFTDLFRPGGR